MGCRSRVGTAISLLLLTGSCTTTTEITLPALDASPTTMAEALVVQTDYSRGFEAPRGVVRGAGEGASLAAGKFTSSVLQSSLRPEAMLIELILVPIGLPISAAVGAGMAHSKEEVDAAVAAFETIGRDKNFLASIDRRFVETLDKDVAKRWTCIEAASLATHEPCTGYLPVARLNLRPAFRLEATGKYDPDIHFVGDVVAIASLAHGEVNALPEVVLEAKWEYHEELGKFFALAEDDASLLRRKLSEILDRFALRMADDLYLAPRPQNITRKEEFGRRVAFGRRSVIEIPEGVVVRVEQGSDLTSLATHGIVRPKGSSSLENCWVDAVDARPTGHGYDTAIANRDVMVKAGNARLTVTCTKHRGSINEKTMQNSIEVTVELGVIYLTDGRSYERLQH